MIITVNFRIEAIGKKKPEKKKRFNGIRTHDLRVAGAYNIFCDIVTSKCILGIGQSCNESQLAPLPKLQIIHFSFMA